jgi:hypothetical protein
VELRGEEEGVRGWWSEVQGDRRSWPGSRLERGRRRRMGAGGREGWVGRLRGWFLRWACLDDGFGQGRFGFGLFGFGSAPVRIEFWLTQNSSANVNILREKYFGCGARFRCVGSG